MLHTEIVFSPPAEIPWGWGVAMSFEIPKVPFSLGEVTLPTKNNGSAQLLFCTKFFNRTHWVQSWYQSLFEKTYVKSSLFRILDFLPSSSKSAIRGLQVSELAASAEQLTQERFKIEALKEMEEENISNKLQRQIEYLIGYIKVGPQSHYIERVYYQFVPWTQPLLCTASDGILQKSVMKHCLWSRGSTRYFWYQIELIDVHSFQSQSCHWALT